MERRRVTSRRHRRQLVGAVCVLGLVWLAGGAALKIRTGAPPRRPPQQSTRKGGKGARVKPFPSSRIVATTQHPAPGAGDLFTVPAVAAYLAGGTGDVTAAVYDDVSGYTSLFRPGVAQDTASIMKADILATLLAQSQVHAQPLSPAEQLLSQNMIEESDNDDAQDLWNSEGGATAVNAFDTAAGLTQTQPDAAGYWGLSTTTAADQVQLLR
jgi:hypothetical protein